MVKKGLIVLVVSLLLITIGYNVFKKNQLGEPHMIGYVMSRGASQILVVDPNPEDFSATGGISAFYDAALVSNAPEDILVGQQVNLWFDGPVADSYPYQGKAGKVEVIPANQPNGANLNDAQALNQVLTSNEFNSSLLMAVQSIEFDKDAAQWNIELYNVWKEETSHFTVEDK